MAVQEQRSTGGSNTPTTSVSRKHLINLLNHANFQEGCVVVNLKNIERNRKLSLRAIPDPCDGERVRLVWTENPPRHMDVSSHEFVDFLIDKGSRVVRVNGRVVNLDRSSMTVDLPERCYATSRRSMERFASARVRAIISREGTTASGVLLDFGGGFIKVRCTGHGTAVFPKSGDKNPIELILENERTTVYNGKGIIARRIANGEHLDVVVALVPVDKERELEEQEIAVDRNLFATCRHPLSDRIVRLLIIGLSYSFFVVREQPEHITLFSGLVIPEMRIDFGAGDFAECSAQVVSGVAGNWTVSILDMPIAAQRKLFSFVEKETGMQSSVSTAIDPKDLIEFLFDVGFVYPSKYASFAHSREHIKKILSRLYIDTPLIAQHFIQYNNGMMEAHIAMVRFYERSWVVHHHTAMGGSGAGSAVLSQIFRYVHSYGALPSTGMAYLMTYYRPENHFPNRVLGGFARFLAKPRLCSVDSFAYLHIHFNAEPEKTCDESDWQLVSASHEDLLALESFYDDLSGGLTVKAFGLESTSRIGETIDLDAEFQKAGLRRRKSILALKKKGKLKAVMMALDSDTGLNMSNLMKCIHAFIIDADDLSFTEVISQANRLSPLYDVQEVPILVFPSAFANNQGVKIEKVYDLLVFDALIVKQFIRFVERLTNRALRRKYRETTSDSGGKACEQP
jgi:hypothetical protein